jgi:hypothetical protein
LKLGHSSANPDLTRSPKASHGRASATGGSYMAKNNSGVSLTAADIPIVLGMNARGDRHHDIAAWFGVNAARIAEAKAGKWGVPPFAPLDQLPPTGPPGIKGRRLRESAEEIGALLAKGDLASAKKALGEAISQYDANEP